MSARHLPHSRDYAIVQGPTFQTTGAMSWNEGLTPTDDDETYRVRIGRDLRDLPLIRRDRPRCWRGTRPLLHSHPRPEDRPLERRVPFALQLVRQ